MDTLLWLSELLRIAEQNDAGWLPRRKTVVPIVGFDGASYFSQVILHIAQCQRSGERLEGQHRISWRYRSDKSVKRLQFFNRIAFDRCSDALSYHSVEIDEDARSQ
jgi:hypothetical protein